MITWTDWGAQPFARARAENKPILLHLGATWCHWCHVMDEDTWSHPEVARVVMERFVPVRVDTDHRPDVNERYNQGGWPTVAVLDASGEVLVGRLYMPPHEALPLLLSATDPAQRWAVGGRSAEPTPPPVEVPAILAAVKKAFDPYYGGFGEIEKFPHPLVCGWLADRLGRGEDEGGMLAPSLRALATRGLVDHEEGGFFRYCTMDDWSAPHLEKLLEDHARIVDLLVRTRQHREVAEAAVRWMIRHLWMDDALAFAGSMDADEGYYARSPRQGPPPPVDRTVYAGWNGLAIAALVRAGVVWRRPGLVSLARRAAQSLLARVGEDGGVRRTPEGVVGLAEDQAGAAEGLLAVYRHDGDVAWREAAERALGWARTHLAAEGSGFLDARPVEEGRLRDARRSLHANAALGEAAWKLGVLTGEASWMAMAREAADAALAEGERYGFMAAPAAALAERLGRAWKVVKVNGAPELFARVTEDPNPDLLALNVKDGVPDGCLLVCGEKSCGVPARAWG